MPKSKELLSSEDDLSGEEVSLNSNQGQNRQIKQKKCFNYLQKAAKIKEKAVSKKEKAAEPEEESEEETEVLYIVNKNFD